MLYVTLSAFDNIIQNIKQPSFISKFEGLMLRIYILNIFATYKILRADTHYPPLDAIQAKSSTWNRDLIARAMSNLLLNEAYIKQAKALFGV